MPRLMTQLPPPLKPFVALGLDVAYVPGREEAMADCPMCGAEGKWSVNSVTTKWQCWLCKATGNATTLCRQLAEAWGADDQRTWPAGLTDLARARKLLHPETLLRWGVMKSPLTGEWLIPAYGPTGEVKTLYRYGRPAGASKPTLLALPELGVGLFGMGQWDAAKPDAFVTEGCWDGMALEEVLRGAKTDDSGGLVGTGAVDRSLAAAANVVAVPGCGTFPDAWAAPFGGKCVTLCYDSDHPKLLCAACRKSWSRVTHQACPTCKGPLGEPETPPQGHESMRRVAGVLASAPVPPKEVRYFEWGPEGYAADRVSGYDVRDFLTEGE